MPIGCLTFYFGIEEANCLCKNKRFFYAYFAFDVQLYENQRTACVK